MQGSTCLPRKGFFELCLILLVFCIFCRAQPSGGSTTPFLPPSWPLAVKNPYLNTWLTSHQSGGILSKTTPGFWPAWDDVCYLLIFSPHTMKICSLFLLRSQANNLDMLCGRRRRVIYDHGFGPSPTYHVCESNRR